MTTAAAYSKRIEKPWGYEIVLSPENSQALGKIALTRAGKRWSLQFHDQKEETLALISGRGKIILENEKGELEELEMVPQTGYTIKPMQKHRFIAETECITFEVSTPEIGKTVRLEDDYQRPDETEEIRKLPNRGWNNG